MNALLRDKDINAGAYAAIRDSAIATERQLERLAAAVTHIGKALLETAAAVNQHEEVLIQNGLNPDSLLLRAKWLNVTKMALHMESEGVIGETRTLDTPTQLKQSGRASLKKLGADFNELTLRQARARLGIT